MVRTLSCNLCCVLAMDPIWLVAIKMLWRCACRTKWSLETSPRVGGPLCLFAFHKAAQDACSHLLFLDPRLACVAFESFARATPSSCLHGELCPSRSRACLNASTLVTEARRLLSRPSPSHGLPRYEVHSRVFKRAQGPHRLSSILSPSTTTTEITSHVHPRSRGHSRSRQDELL